MNFTIKLVKTEEYNLQAEKIIKSEFKKNEVLSEKFEKLLKEKMKEEDLPSAEERKIFFYEFVYDGHAFILFFFFDERITLGGFINEFQNPMKLNPQQERELLEFLN